MALAIADNAFFGINSVEDFYTQEIEAGKGSKELTWMVQSTYNRLYDQWNHECKLGYLAFLDYREMKWLAFCPYDKTPDSVLLVATGAYYGIYSEHHDLKCIQVKQFNTVAKGMENHDGVIYIVRNDAEVHSITQKTLKERLSNIEQL